MLVSVLIPAFRAQRTIARAVRSVLTQQYADWEIVIACDDDTDYLGLLVKLGIDTAKIQVISTGTIGSGEASARNAGLEVARGDFIAPLDADDAFDPARLRELVPIAHAVGAATDNTAVYYGGNVAKMPFPFANIPFNLKAPDILSHRIPLFPVFRRELAGNGWTSVTFASDVLFNLEILSRSFHYIASHLPLYQYFKTAESITSSGDTWKLAEEGYKSILQMLTKGQLDLDHEIRNAALAEFRENLVLNRLFRKFFEAGLYKSLDEFLDASANGRAEWVRPYLARIKENERQDES